MTGRARCIFLLIALVLAMQACITEAVADDAELEEILPGHWTCPSEATEEDPGEAGPVQLDFGKDGAVSIQCWYGEEYGWTCEGTWSFELVTGGMDRLTLQLVWVDHPDRPGNGYATECVYNVYAESWTENDTEYTAFLLEETEDGNGDTPFRELYGYDGAAMYREKKPNMRVVNCSNYVSQREERSTSSARIMKVPLGAQVLASPEAGEENGFIRCIYHDKTGYILSEYLEMIE